MITSSIYQKIKQRRILRTLNHLRETQFWSYQAIREYQFDKIKRLLEHSYQNVPYYRSVFKTLGASPADIKTFDDYKSFPLLTKEIIRENFSDFAATNMSKDDLIANSTGGSTGEPLHFFQDRQYEVWADAARIRGWYHIAGCEMGDSCAVLWGAVRDVKKDFSFFETVRAFLTSGEVFLNAFNLSEERKFKFYRWCRAIRPKLLRGYVTAVEDFAVFLDECVLELPSVKGVILCAETVDMHSQAYIEKIFKVPSYNTYGGRELSLIAMECSRKNGLHEVSENNYVEFEPIDLAGYEDCGNLIITNLNNYAMPFIRYRIGDIGVPTVAASCDCGRGLPLIKRVIGRTTEIFSFPDGTRVAGEMFIHLMKDFNIRHYQFVQVSDSKVILRLKRSECVSSSLKKDILKTYGRFLPSGVELNFHEVEDFTKSPTGKLRFVYRDFSGS